MAEENPLFFKQLLSGVDVGTTDSSARQMANFIYLIGDRQTRECLVVDPAGTGDAGGHLEHHPEGQSSHSTRTGSNHHFPRHNDRFKEPWR